LARDNYSYQRYKKEEARKKKKEEKKQRKLDRKNTQPEEIKDKDNVDVLHNST